MTAAKSFINHNISQKILSVFNQEYYYNDTFEFL